MHTCSVQCPTARTYMWFLGCTYNPMRACTCTYMWFLGCTYNPMRACTCTYMWFLGCTYNPMRACTCTYMWFLGCTYNVCEHVHALGSSAGRVLCLECRGFESHPRQLIFLRKSDCLRCAVLLCLVVCLTLLASFFLPSYLSLKHVHVIRDFVYKYTPLFPKQP